MRELMDIHRALADETRLRIVALLLELGELCVCDVESGLDISQSRASRHMSQLRQAALVKERRQGQWVYYRIAEPLPHGAPHALAGVREAAARHEQVQRDLEATRASRKSPCRDS